MTPKRSAGCVLRQARWVIFFMPVSYSFSKSRDCVESEHEENNNEMVENGFFLILPCVLVGCGKTRDTAKIRDLEFTVIDQERIPEELKAIIEEKKVQPFKMTYSDEEKLYIVTGYGPQETGGYSIQVKELYLTENAIVFDTELSGPEKGETVTKETSYPVIVIQTELLETPVIFQ